MSFYCWASKILYMFWYKSLFKIHHLQVFSPILWVTFSLYVVFLITKVLNFDQIQFIFCFVAVLLLSYLRNNYLVQGRNLLQCFYMFHSSSSYTWVFHLFWVSFLYCMREESHFIILFVAVHFSWHHLLKRLLSPLCLGIPWKTQWL